MGKKVEGQPGRGGKIVWEKPSGEQGDLAKPYGGIRPNQVLYHKRFGDYGTIAMIWTCGNGQHMTLKLARAGMVVLNHSLPV